MSYAESSIFTLNDNALHFTIVVCVAKKIPSGLGHIFRRTDECKCLSGIFFLSSSVKIKIFCGNFFKTWLQDKCCTAKHSGRARCIPQI